MNVDGRAMRIAFVSDAVYPYNKGGKERRLYEISTRLARKGHDVHIYCMKWWKGSPDRVEDGVHLHAISKFVPLYTKSGTRSIYQGLYFGVACLKLIKEDFDIVDVDHMPYFPIFSVKLVALLKRKTMFCTWHEVWSKDYWVNYIGAKGVIGYAVEKASSMLPDKIISISDNTTDKLRKDLHSHRKVYTIANGTEFSKIQRLKASNQKSDVIFVGRLLSNKNVDVLIKAVALLGKNVRCFIIGEGPEKGKLVALVKRLNLGNVKFFGALESHDDVLSLIKSSKVFVLPSTREGFGIVVIEANACGVPVVTINHEDNAAKDLIKENVNGYLSSLDEKELAKSIIRAIKISKKMKTNCLGSAKQYDWDKIVRGVEGRYMRC